MSSTDPSVSTSGSGTQSWWDSFVARLKALFNISNLWTLALFIFGISVAQGVILALIGIVFVWIGFPSIAAYLGSILMLLVTYYIALKLGTSGSLSIPSISGAWDGPMDFIKKVMDGDVVITKDSISFGMVICDSSFWTGLMAIGIQILFIAVLALIFRFGIFTALPSNWIIMLPPSPLAIFQDPMGTAQQLLTGVGAMTFYVLLGNNAITSLVQYFTGVICFAS